MAVVQGLNSYRHIEAGDNSGCVQLVRIMPRRPDCDGESDMQQHIVNDRIG